MTDTLESVLDDIKNEKVENAIKKYGKFLVLGAVVAIIIVLLFNWWRLRQDDLIHSEAAQYLKAQYMLREAQDQKKLQEGVQDFEKLAGGKTIYATLAQISAANLASALSDTNKAYALYDAVSANANYDPTLRSFGALMKVVAEIKKEKSVKQDMVIAFKKSSSAEVFPYVSRLIEASMLLELNQKQEAKALLDSLRASESPEQQTGIVELLLGLTNSE